MMGDVGENDPARYDRRMSFHVDLSAFRGPLDLLLYLVRKHELDVTEISIATIAQQFVEHLDVLQELDANAVGDFLDVASTLIEMKSKLLLPRAELEEEILEDPREGLVERLLEYKRYRDAASILDEQCRDWQQRFPRVADDSPDRSDEPANQPIEEVELWDLVSAMGRIMRSHQVVQSANIVYDDTPIHVYMQRIHQQLVTTRRVLFSQMFQPGMHKSAMIGIFLAVLELVRHHGVRTEQDELQSDIAILPGDCFRDTIDPTTVDDYDRRLPSDDETSRDPR